MPSRTTISNSILDKHFLESITQIKKNLEKCLTFSATTDCWTSRQNISYIGVTIHYVDDDFKLINQTYCVEHLPGSHTAAVLQSKIHDLFCNDG